MSEITLTPAGGDPINAQVDIGRVPSGDDDFVVRIGDSVVDGSRHQRGSEGVLRLGARVLPYLVARKGRRLWLWLDGAIYRFDVGSELGDSAAAPGAGLPPGGLIEAPMPGRVLKQVAAPGGMVNTGDPLVILESMKMELTVSAPAPAVVAETLAEPGTMVQRGTALLRLATRPS